MQVAHDLEVLSAKREQIELQKDLLKREYAIATGQDEPLSHEQAGHVSLALTGHVPSDARRLSTFYPHRHTI